MKIYTKTGDSGQTSLKNSFRVSKTDIRIETNGVLDELNTAIGMVRAAMTDDNVWQFPLKNIQLNLMRLMSWVADIRDNEVNESCIISTMEIVNIEHLIDKIDRQTEPSDYFILPGGNQLSSFLHFARVTTRRAERTLCHLSSYYPIPESVLAYINRLSDLFFTMARHELQEAGITEERWKMFSTRKPTK